MNNKLFTLIAVSQIVMLSACNNLNAVSDQTKQVQHQQENDETAQQKEAEPSISEKEQNAQKTSEEVPMAHGHVHDPSNPPVDCPLRKQGIDPTQMKPFEQIEAYIQFLDREDRKI